jgi:hypothetical protein
MTTGRIPSSGLAAFLLCLAVAGCGGTSQGCIQCSPVDGRYALEFGTGVTPGSCQGVTVTLPQGPLDMTRQGSELTAQLDGLTLRGTLYESNNFNLLGSSVGNMDGGTAGLESESLTGRYVAGVGDGGVDTLIGDWQGNFTSTSTGGPRRCSVTRPFTATRQ